jgi:hypothetical protein
MVIPQISKAITKKEATPVKSEVFEKDILLFSRKSFQTLKATEDWLR